MAAANMRSPGIIARRRLQKLIEARVLPEGVSVKKMQEAVLEAGKTVTTEELEQMYAMV